MKKIITILSLLISVIGISQTATSISNGNWTNPLTWNCTCVPLPGYTVTIAHDVVLNTDFVLNTGGITINNSASLTHDATGRDLWLNGGNFTNNGNLEIRFMLNQAGTFSNDGTITLRSISNSINFTNNGTFENIDSLFNTASIINNGNFINIDSITNNGTFVNNGTCVFTDFTNNGVFNNENSLTFHEITNVNELTNSDSIIATKSMWNLGKITNNLGANVILNKSLLNENSLSGTALIINNGEFLIEDSFYNFDTIKGTTGKFSVQDSSVNYGYMKQTFDFCDHTPNPSPNIDYNFGTISPNVTYCSTASIDESILDQISIYPNPTTEVLTIISGNLKNCTFNLYSLENKLILSNLSAGETNISELAQGIYYLTIENYFEKSMQKIKIIKM
jgi:hypothetical protein